MSSVLSALCPCGSGLQAKRCCELDRSLEGTATGGPPPRLARRAEQALGALRRQDVILAERLCREVLEQSPVETTALTVLYEICKGQRKAAAAEALIRRVVALNPDDLYATNELGLLLLAKGDLAESEAHARNAVRLAPQNPQAHNLMGMVMTEARRPQVGEYHYRRTLDLMPARDPILLANLAWNLKTQGRMEEARQLYRESVTAAPQARQTLLGWARLEEADRNLDAAGELLDRLERLFPDDPAVMLAQAVVLGRQDRGDEALTVLDRMARLGGSLGPVELLEKGRLLDRMERYDDAFAAFSEGKRLMRELTGKTYMAEPARQLARRLQRFFVRGRLDLLPCAGPRQEIAQPLFILGFPRSGTTLMEQMLSAHPQIAAGDELPLIPEIIALMPRQLGSPFLYPEALTELWMGDQRHGLGNLRDYYLQRVQQLGILAPGVGWFTDKMPLNETHLGLIALLFPHAPLLHMVRHPLDVVLSVFANSLTHGFYCAFDLEGAARHYALVMELVEHYRREMPLRYLMVRYEEVVSDQESKTHRILDFVGAEFNERCLHFYENKRYARTASYAQVTEPLYSRSIYRYRHYLRHLEPVLAILAPVIERLGYRVP